MDRFSALREKRYDVVVVGAGATGVGIARDAALRGLTVLLLDRGDIASGTSSGSSRLIHGGLRYLLQGQLELVRECLQERQTLEQLAPHLVRPATFLMALYRGPVRERWPFYLGLKLARYMAKNPAEPHVQQLSIDQLMQIVPGLRRQGLRGGIRFRDAITNDARLCLEVALGAQAAGATVATSVEVLQIASTPGGPTRLRVRDRRSLAEGNKQEITIECSVAVQALGPWTGQLDVGGGEGALVVEPARGSHLALPPMVPADTVLAAPHPIDSRFTFAIGFDTHTWLGTTDLPHEGTPDSCRTTAQEAAYLNAWAAAYLPAIAGRAWLARAALRPIVGGIGRSRDFRYGFTDRGVFVIAGGKITTHRSMAEKAVDALVKAPAFAGKSFGPCRTAKEPLPGAPPLALSEWLQEGPGHRLVPEAVRRHLLLRYGARAESVILRIARDPELAAPLHPERAEVLAEVDFAVDEELAVSLTDVMWRRTGLAFCEDGGAAAVDVVADRMATRLGWTQTEARQQREGFERERAQARADAHVSPEPPQTTMAEGAHP